MKAFKKWVNNLESEFISSGQGTWFCDGDREYDAAEEGWKAALEWALNLNINQQNILLEDENIVYDVRSRWSIVRGKIKKELEDV